ncbi:unnamed protein product [Ectocarpus fasciculatus]
MYRAVDADYGTHIIQSARDEHTIVVNRTMSAGKREALDTALRRTLGFHLGADVAGEDGEVLVSALLDSAEEGRLVDSASVGQEFDDYLPDVACCAASSKSSPSSPSSEHKEEVELYEDVLRDALKHFPLAPSNPEEDGSGNGADDSVSEPGCCSLCERLMPLTRHHVMPKSTHKRYRKKGYSDAVLNGTIAICRPCHSAVHRAHDALALAERFTTVEELLADETIGRFVAWARKQRTTSVQDSRNNLLRYRR